MKIVDSNHHLINAFREVFSLCGARQSEKTVLLFEHGSRKDSFQLAVSAFEHLGVEFQTLRPIADQMPSGPIVKSTGASVALDNNDALTDILCNSDFIVDMTVEGLMHAKQTPMILGSGARILNVSNEHPEVLARLVPDPQDREVAKKAVKQCRSATQMQVSSSAGTALAVDMAEARTVGVWGWTDRPGTLAHWPGGLVVSFPAPGTVRGTIVMAPGDVNLTFKRYLESEIILSIEDDYIVDIAGQGADAQLMRTYLNGFDDPNAFATSHVGWGLNRRARYEALTMYDKSDTNGTELRALSGNFLYSTGANEFANRFTRGHFDLPMMNCTIRLDGTTVVDQGVVVEGALV